MYAMRVRVRAECIPYARERHHSRSRSRCHRHRLPSFLFLCRGCNPLPSHTILLSIELSIDLQHSPTQAHDHDVEANAHIGSLKRRRFAGMITGVDRGMRRVVEALKANRNRGTGGSSSGSSGSSGSGSSGSYSMWERTLLWFLSDNGAELTQGGSNWPLRGGKGR